MDFVKWPVRHYLLIPNLKPWTVGHPALHSTNPGQGYNAVWTALALPIAVHALNPLVTTLLSSYMSICAQFSNPLTLLSSIQPIDFYTTHPV